MRRSRFCSAVPTSAARLNARRACTQATSKDSGRRCTRGLRHAHKARDSEEFATKVPMMPGAGYWRRDAADGKKKSLLVVVVVTLAIDVDEQTRVVG